MPKRGELPVLAAAKPLAQAHQHQQRSHAPRNPKHGQKAAQLVGRNGAEHLAESVGKLCISVGRREGCSVIDTQRRGWEFPSVGSTISMAECCRSPGFKVETGGTRLSWVDIGAWAPTFVAQIERPNRSSFDSPPSNSAPQTKTCSRGPRKYVWGSVRSG